MPIEITLTSDGSSLTGEGLNKYGEGKELGLTRQERAEVGFCVWLIGMVFTVPLFLISELSLQIMDTAQRHLLPVSETSSKAPWAAEDLWCSLT